MNSCLFSMNKSAMLFVLLLCLPFAFLRASNETLTDIILINGNAELVEMDKKGDIIHRLLAVPNYFDSPQSHNSLKKKSMAQVQTVGDINGASKTCPHVLANHFLKIPNTSTGKDYANQASVIGLGTTYVDESSNCIPNAGLVVFNPRNSKQFILNMYARRLTYGLESKLYRYRIRDMRRELPS